MRSTRSLFFAIGLVITLLAGNASGVTFKTVEVAGKRYTLCRVEVRKERLQLFHRDDKGKPFNRFERLSKWLTSKGEKLIFAMNAGMYHGDFSAVGLYVTEGKELSPLNTANDEGNFFLKPNGIFVLTEQGARVVETSAYPALRERERVILATQSGPLLVLDGKLHPAFRQHSDSRLFRNGVGVPSAGIALFVISEDPVNFHEFARLFRDTLKCPNALFFDGTVSSLHSTELNRDDFKMDLGPIIGITK